MYATTDGVPAHAVHQIRFRMPSKPHAYTGSRLTAVKECLRELEGLWSLQRGANLRWTHVQARAYLLLYPGQTSVLGADHADTANNEIILSVSDACRNRPDCSCFAP